MVDPARRPRVVLLGGSWGREHDERAFAARSVAAGLSRLVPVEVVVPGPPGGAPAGAGRADGAFDLLPVGAPPGRPANGAAPGGWPRPADARWPASGAVDLVVVDDADLGALALADHFLPGVPVAPVVSWAAAPGRRDAGATGTPGTPGPALAVGVGAERPAVHEVGLHVPVHALAGAQPHVGLGFTDYVLVLGDRGPASAGDPAPTPLAAWLATRFADRHVVVVENAVATVWRSRSLRGLVSVDTRTDLWRLVAHARVTVDLAPGPLLARECVESLRYGVPVVVPAGGAAARLAARGGGLWFRDVAELLGCVAALDDQERRDTLGAQGRQVAAERYGDPATFVQRLGAALAAATGCHLPAGPRR